MSTPGRWENCPNPSRSHLYGASKCLVCGSPAPPKPRLGTGGHDGTSVDRRLREHPGAFITVGRQTVRNDGIEDVAGWGDDGDPWAGGAA